MTIEQLQELRKQKGYSYEDIARLSGVPMSTVQKVLGGITKRPRYQTLTAIAAVLQDNHSGDADETPADKPGSTERSSRPPVNYLEIPRDIRPSYVADAAPVYRTKRQGEYTIEDYHALPEDERYELIDGVLIKMDSPSVYHQRITGFLYHKICSYVEDNGGDCLPLIAPCDVQLDCDDYTIVEPDVMIVCDKEKDIKSRIYGAPDFVAEVLSPSTRKKDMTLKLHKYQHAGVREYWILDPQERRILTYFLQDPFGFASYSMKDKVPVGIYNGACEIDFAPLHKQLWGDEETVP